MPCAGKTTVGKALAEKIRYDFLDTDQIIEISEQQDINTLIKNKGEAYFRNVEFELTNNLLKENLCNTVISVGGGLPVNFDNMKKLKEIGITISLDVTLAMLRKRYLENLNEEIKKGNNVENFDYLYEQRKAIYQEAEININVTEMTVSEAVNQIIEQIRVN